MNYPKRKFYDSNEISWFRRNVGEKFIKEGLTKMLVEKDEHADFMSKVLSTFSAKKKNYLRAKTKPKKKFIPRMYFNSTELEKIKHVRDIFYEFDDDKSRTLDLNEMVKMFEVNGIQIKKEQLLKMFNYKESLTLYDLVQLISNHDREEDFRNEMRKIKQNATTNAEKYVPTNFEDMFEFLNENGKVRRNFKQITNNIKRLDKLEKKLEMKRSKKMTAKSEEKDHVLFRFGFVKDVNYKEVEDGLDKIMEMSKKKISKNIHLSTIDADILEEQLPLIKHRSRNKQYTLASLPTTSRTIKTRTIISNYSPIKKSTRAMSIASNSSPQRLKKSLRKVSNLSL